MKKTVILMKWLAAKEARSCQALREVTRKNRNKEILL